MALRWLADLIGTKKTQFSIFRALLDASGLTAARTFTLPDLSGTLALIPSASFSANTLVGADGGSKLTGVALGTGFSISSNTLNLPQDLLTSATPQFARLGLGAAADSTVELLISGASPQRRMTDTTASAKSLVEKVDGNKVYWKEAAGADGDLLTVDLTNQHFGFGTATPKQYTGGYGANARVFTVSANAGRAVLELNNTSAGTSGTVASFYGLNNGAFMAGFEVTADGASNSGRFEFFTANAGSTVFAMNLAKNGNVGLSLGYGVAASYLLQLASDSAGKPGGGSWANSSDARLKRNIKPIDGAEAIAKLNQLQPRTFEWRRPDLHGKKNGRRDAGFVAQEVEKIFPHWITEIDSHGADKHVTGNRKHKSLTLPFEFDALQVAAIKYLSEQLETALQRIEQLEKK